MRRSDPKTGAIEHHLKVERTARYWTLGTPESAEEVWLVLHGYKQLARRFIRRFKPIDNGLRLIVAPEALSRFYVSQEQGRHGVASVVGATWMTREDRLNEIRDYVEYLDQLVVRIEGETGKVPLTVVGFSQGVATAARWAISGSRAPSRLILWGDFSPPDIDLELARQRLGSVELIMVRGTEDRALSPQLKQEEDERLREGGIDYRTISYPGGHDIDEQTLLTLATSGST
ncbi:MAG TPA: phospholipase [Gemmatimonadetes bacterium]|nr:phospholipase [Gemmatimonadota bacterium]|tara:strand:+ start:1033 stop:1725 length:693 start_codon:yes stop_codon:yes gene_type:complete